MEKKEFKRQPVICYSRVVGWLTPTRCWNKGKQSEWTDRKTYEVE